MMGALIIRPARVDEFEAVLGLLGESVRWLESRGSDQWSTWRTWRTKMRPALERGDVWLLFDGDEPVGTVTVELEGDRAFWTPAELEEPSGYVSKLTIRRDHAGRELGALLLEFAADLVWRQGADWLRLDAWKTNLELHRYYTDRGWRYLRTAGADERHSGALFQVPARPLSSATAGMIRAELPMRTLETTTRTLLAADNASGTWQPDHVHEGGLVVDYGHGGRRRALFVDFARYRVLEHAGGWVIESSQVGRRWERHGVVVSSDWDLEPGVTYVLSHLDGEPCRMVVASLEASR